MEPDTVSTTEKTVKAAARPRRGKKAVAEKKEEHTEMATAEQIEAEQRELQQEMEQERNEERIALIVQSQKKFFSTNVTKDPAWRIEQLKKLYAAIVAHEDAIYQALKSDLSKSSFESFTTELGLVLHEISYCIRHIKKWSRMRRAVTDLHLLPAKLRILPEPYGTALVMSTWNYPFLLSLWPVVAAISAGNTVVLKLSEYSAATNRVLDELITKNFSTDFFTVVQGGYLQNHALLNQNFDFIFFTGSQNVGKVVMSNAARFLTPVCLELGGKSPCIVDESAAIAVAARRIVWGKFLNAGQTCVAPDYILVHESVKDSLLAALREEIKRQFGENPLTNEEYPKIINERHFVHLSTLFPQAEMDFVSNKIAPTLIDLCDIKSPDLEKASVMQEEIFGPLLPVITYTNMADVVAYINAHSTPLALYLFTTDKERQQTLVRSIRYGGGCVNDVVYHICSSRLPFGGLGESGIGSYHGRYGFETFSHYKSLLYQAPRFDMDFRYAPHAKDFSFLKKILK